MRRAAHGGAITLVGAALSAVMGFAFNFVLARTLGAHQSGVVFQAIAVFTIATSVAKLGLDTTAVWLLPRLVAEERSRVRAAVIGLLTPSVVIGVAATALWFVVQLFLDLGGAHASVYTAIGLSALFLPAAGFMVVALASTRAFGGVMPFNAIGNVLVPLLRPLGLVVVAWAGGASAAATLAWSAPWLVGAVLAGLVLVVQTRRATSRAGGAWWPDHVLRTEILTYSLPRTVMSGMEQIVIWLDVILVGALLGSTPAGVYGAVSRFVTAGVLVSTALRIVVAPRFSALLARGEHRAVEDLYATTARWILLFGAPVYVLLAVFSPTVLSWLGRGFGSGVASMVALCLGSIVVLAAGNVQSLLLMSGHTGWGAFNKAVVVAFNVVANLVLIPRIGIFGAALSWAASMVLDTGLAAYQVRRATGISLAPSSIGYVTGAVSLCVAAPSALVVVLLGQGSVNLLVAMTASGIVLLGYCYADRSRLRLSELARMSGRESGSLLTHRREGARPGRAGRLGFLARSRRAPSRHRGPRGRRRDRPR